MWLRAIVLAACCAGTAHAEAPDPTPVVLEPITDAPCDAAKRVLQATPDMHVRCTKAHSLVLGQNAGTVELDTLTGTSPTGYAVEIVVREGAATRAVTLGIDTGGCSTTSCREVHLRSTRLRTLVGDHGTLAFGVEIESTATWTATWEKSSSTSIQSDRIACVATGDDFDCQELTVGAPWSECEALGWAGTRMRVRCTSEVQLGISRAPDTVGIPYADVQAVSRMFDAAYRVFAVDRESCAKMVSDTKALIAENADAIFVARAIEAKHGALPASMKSGLRPLTVLLAGNACLHDQAVVAALNQLERI